MQNTPDLLVPRSPGAQVSIRAGFPTTGLRRWRGRDLRSLYGVTPFRNPEKARPQHKLAQFFSRVSRLMFSGSRHTMWSFLNIHDEVCRWTLR